jgi:two-component system, LytTR family, sensor kinase
MRMKPLDFGRVGRAYLMSIAIWSSLSLLTGWQYRIFDQQLNIHSTLLQMVLLAESRGFAYALLTPPIFYFVYRYGGRMKHSSGRVWCVYGAGLCVFMILYSCIRWLVLPPWDPILQMYVPRSKYGPFEVIRAGFADQITIYIALIVAAHAYEYFERIRKQELERTEFQRALAASELQALKMQLHPHFLFNTLHGIATLIDSDQKNAKTMIIKLSALLRKSLGEDTPDLIPLRNELQFAREYLDLEKIRFGTRLKITESIESGTENALVPHFVLQPLVENAIRHGAARSREGGWIEVSSQTHVGTIELTIRNSIHGAHSPGVGLGIRNTEARLRCLYAEDASFSFSVHAGVATATVLLPMLNSEEHVLPQTLVRECLESHNNDACTSC